MLQDRYGNTLTTSSPAARDAYVIGIDRLLGADAQIELQDFTNGLRNIETALHGNPRNGHAAHIRGHLYYELGERKEGLQFLSQWAKDYPKDAHIHCHISWHQAIWSLETGRRDDAWSIYLRDLHPGGSWGPQINVLTDCASFLARAEMAGETVDPELWRATVTLFARLSTTPKAPPPIFWHRLREVSTPSPVKDGTKSFRSFSRSWRRMSALAAVGPNATFWNTPSRVLCFEMDRPTPLAGSFRRAVPRMVVVVFRLRDWRARSDWPFWGTQSAPFRPADPSPG